MPSASPTEQGSLSAQIPLAMLCMECLSPRDWTGDSCRDGCPDVFDPGQCSGRFHGGQRMINERSRIIILNGVGSAGKSSIARALQAMTVRPFLHVEMDAFLAMLPPSMLGHPDGIVFDAVRQDGSPMVIIRTGEVARRAFRGMRHA